MCEEIEIVAIVAFDRRQPIPLVDAVVRGPRSSQRVRLVFDTGAGLTILDTPLIEEIGYSARDGSIEAGILSAMGEEQAGYVVAIDSIAVLGKKWRSVHVGAFDFDHFEHFGAHGLLGFDLIKGLHLEMDGPAGRLAVY